jgi:hypothetical protein
VADDDGVIQKVVLFDLWQRVTGETTVLRGFSEMSPEVRKVTFFDDYALVTWVWGDGGGQTVLVKENEGWRVIAVGNGKLNFSTLVQYKIPHRLARTLINRDKGAPDNQPPVADLFNKLLPQLQEKIDAFIFLPSELPQSKQPIYVKSEFGANNYKIDLSWTRNCQTNSPCLIGSFIAKPVDPIYHPLDMFTKDVPLANGLWGYFTPSRCDISCTPSKIEWQWEGFSYQIELKGIGKDVNEEETVMVGIANSAIAAGPR